jgi:hypothetical protein
VFSNRGDKCYISDTDYSFNMRRWIHARSIIGTVMSDPDSSFPMNNRAMAGRVTLPGLRSTSGSATLTAAADQLKDGYTVDPPSPTTANEVICCTSGRSTWADDCAIGSPSFSIGVLPCSRRKPTRRIGTDQVSWLKMAY